MSDQINPLDPTAPLHALMSVQLNPALKGMSDEELTRLVGTFRSYTAPTTLAAKIKSEKKPTSTRAKKLEDLFNS